MFRRSSASRAGHRQPGPQGRCSSSTDATNAGELTAAGWPRQVTIHRIGPKSFAVKKFQGQGGGKNFARAALWRRLRRSRFGMLKTRLEIRKNARKTMDVHHLCRACVRVKKSAELTLSAGLKPPNHKRVYRVMKVHGLLLDRYAGGVERRHDGRIAVDERNRAAGATTASGCGSPSHSIAVIAGP